MTAPTIPCSRTIATAPWARSVPRERTPPHAGKALPVATEPRTGSGMPRPSMRKPPACGSARSTTCRRDPTGTGAQGPHGGCCRGGSRVGRFRATRTARSAACGRHRPPRRNLPERSRDAPGFARAHGSRPRADRRTGRSAGHRRAETASPAAPADRPSACAQARWRDCLPAPGPGPPMASRRGGALPPPRQDARRPPPSDARWSVPATWHPGAPGPAPRRDPPSRRRSQNRDAATRQRLSVRSSANPEPREWWTPGHPGRSSAS